LLARLLRCWPTEVVPLATLLPKAPRCLARRPRWPGNHRRPAHSAPLATRRWPRLLRAPMPARRPKAPALHRRPLSPEGKGDRVPGPAPRRSGPPLRAWRPENRSPAVAIRGPRRSPDVAASPGVGFFLQGL